MFAAKVPKAWRLIYLSLYTLLAATGCAEIDQSSLPEASHGSSLLAVATKQASLGASQVANATCKKIVAPSVLYLGWGHSGSTTLAKTLNDHPYLSYGSTKEHSYFCRDHKQSNNRNREWKTYLSEFEVPCNVKRTFDASPSYHHVANRHAKHCLPEFQGLEGLKHMKELLPPDVQLIFMLRDPLDWLQSRWRMKLLRRAGVKRLVRMTCYANIIEEWLKVFPRDNVLILDSKSLFEDPQPFFNELFEFLEVPRLREEYYDRMYKAVGRRRHTSAVNHRDRVIFQHFGKVQECHKRLEALAGRRFDWVGITRDEEKVSNATEM
mmetsp:Transcript_67257/g.161209  ORF Transcript_67257/g.161209 Transcript_67257/m.161209 type:complete len:323 (-) Transcript_67257:301-1269(-)